jgi:mycoredoxin
VPDHLGERARDRLRLNAGLDDASATEGMASRTSAAPSAAISRRISCRPVCKAGPVSRRTKRRRLVHCLVLGLGDRVTERGTVDRESDEVVIYWRPDCIFCLDLLLRLRFTRLYYRKIDIRKDPAARAFVRSVADGNETVPTVVVADRALVNPSKRQLLEAVRAYAPGALARLSATHSP